MTRPEAHRLLDAARAGRNVSAQAITEALCATGDIADFEPTQVLRPSGTWERRAPADLLRRAEPFDGLAA